VVEEVVEEDVMSSNAIVFLKAVLVSVGVMALTTLPVMSVRAEPPQTLSAQPTAATQPHTDAGSVAGASSILKVSATPARSATAGAPEPIGGTPPQLSPVGTVVPLPSGSSTAPAGVRASSGDAGASANKADGATPVSAAAGASAPSSIQLQVDGLELFTPAQRQTYQRASSTFTSFCHDWERLLHEREVNNLEHLSWREAGGVKTATYTGYGKVESCECKESKEGLPIGKIRYRELLYSIAGKTIDEARHAAPKLTHEVSTLEIFSWDKGKWFY
jgi:hypothetical protein